MISTNRLIAKIPTLAAMAYKYSVGQPFNFPDNELSYSENFLKMCFAVPTEKYNSQKVLSDAIEKIFILAGYKGMQIFNKFNKLIMLFLILSILSLIPFEILFHKKHSNLYIQ